MKAEIITQIICPECKQPMYTSFNGGIVECYNPGCEMLNKKFHAPVVELEPLEEIPDADKRRDNEINEREYPSFQ